LGHLHRQLARLLLRDCAHEAPCPLHADASDVLGHRRHHRRRHDLRLRRGVPRHLLPGPHCPAVDVPDAPRRPHVPRPRVALVARPQGPPRAGRQRRLPPRPQVGRHQLPRHGRHDAPHHRPREDGQGAQLPRALQGRRRLPHRYCLLRLRRPEPDGQPHRQPGRLLLPPGRHRQRDGLRPRPHHLGP
ncbi:hypothetical protein BN1723_019449, partial [Verticillium longisporum]